MATRAKKAEEAAGKDAILKKLTDEANEKAQKEEEMLMLRNTLHWQVRAGAVTPMCAKAKRPGPMLTVPG